MKINQTTLLALAVAGYGAYALWNHYKKVKYLRFRRFAGYAQSAGLLNTAVTTEDGPPPNYDWVRTVQQVSS